MVQPKFLIDDSADNKTSTSKVISPMTGICDKILVEAGDQVEENQLVAVIIAMKMEYALKAPKKGIVKSISSKLGKNVSKGDVIVSFVEENSI